MKFLKNNEVAYISRNDEIVGSYGKNSKTYVLALMHEDCEVFTDQTVTILQGSNIITLGKEDLELLEKVVGGKFKL